MITAKGNGKLAVNIYPVSSFLHLHLSVNGMIELHQSKEEKVEVETDDNMFGHISVVNSGRTLFVTSGSGYKRPAFTSIKVRIYIRQIKKLHICCDGGEVICPAPIALLNSLEVKAQSTGNIDLKIDAPALKLLLQNKGNVTLTGKCTDVDIKTQADGNLFAKELVTGILKIKNMSSGNVEVYANRLISIAHYGEGFIHYYGDAVLHDVNNFGAGQVKHFESVN